MLYGRSTEQARLAEVMAGAREGSSGALVVRGEPGIGKTALLEWAAHEAGDMRVLRVTGIEQEADLAFAGLAQLLWPVQDRIEALPAPQAEALRAVFSCTYGGQSPDRFLIGLAVLTLLAELAEDQPVLCLVDDAQWLDQASAEALLFAARRLTAEGVAMVFATREDGFAAAGLAEARLPRLDHDSASGLLTEHGLAAALREDVIAESAGNPLALIEFAAAQRGNASGGAHLHVADRVLASYRAQIVHLSEPTRLMMLIAAAEGRGDLTMLLRAAKLMDVGLDDLEEAEQAGLVQVIDGSVGFRHPLIATAAYQGAPMARRVAVHRALAEASPTADCRVHHLSAATTHPDESVAAELTAAAERARSRGAYNAAARLYRQAARLSPEEKDQVTRLDRAADASLSAGHPAQAADLAEQAEQLATTALPAKQLAELAPVRAAALFELGERARAVHLLIERAGHADADRAAALLRTGATYAWFSCEAAAVRTAAQGLIDLGRPDPMVAGLAHLVEEDYTRGLPELARFLAEPGQARPAEVMYTGAIVGDDAATLDLAAAEVARAREHGLVGALPEALRVLAQTQVRAGLHREAELAVAEAMEIVKDTGLPKGMAWLTSVPARIAAVEGDIAAARDLAAQGPEEDSAINDITLSLLDLGLGAYESALRRLDSAWQGPGANGIDLLAAAADQVEAAVRLGRPDLAEEPLRRFTTWAEAGGQPWALAVAARSRALLAGDDAAEHFARAVHLHQQSGRPFERARTELLYGEWLRRARRRSDARVPLRSALEIFERLRAAPWAERTRAELRATGESVVAAEPTAANPLDRLTAQELQVVRLAADGLSAKEIAAQLFLSKRTVEHHLYKAYPKLGIGSRRELARLDLANVS